MISREFVWGVDYLTILTITIHLHYTYNYNYLTRFTSKLGLHQRSVGKAPTMIAIDKVDDLCFIFWYLYLIIDLVFDITYKTIQCNDFASLQE